MIAFLAALLILGWFDWRTVKTDNFIVIYKPGYEWEAAQTLMNLEYYGKGVVSLTGNSPGKFSIVVEDLGTLTNGFADPIFRNIHIFTYPPGGSVLSENWYRLVAVHEYTHICHLTKTRGLASVPKILLGTPFQPNLYSPGWVIEGITVFSESQISPYEGRLNDGYFDAYIGTRAKDRKLPSIHTTTYSPLEFPYGTGIYLYGGEFFNYLASKYGKEKFSKLFSSYGSYFWAPLVGLFFPALGIDKAAERVYGRSLSSLYSEWCLYEEERYKDWEIKGKRLTRKGWYITSLEKDEEKLYYVRQYPKKTDALNTFFFTKIIAQDIKTQKERTVASLTSSVSSPLRIIDEKLYYTTFEIKGGYANVTQQGFGYTSLLRVRDLKTHKDRVLFSDAIRAFCVLADGRILYSRDKKHGFGSELWIWAKGKKEKLWDTDYLVGELYANSHYIGVAARKDFENWNVYMLDLNQKKFMPIATTPWIENNVRIEGNTLLFTANYDKTYSIYAYDLKTQKLYRLTYTGYANFGIIAEDSLYFVGLTKDGFDLYKKAIEAREYTLRNWIKSLPPDYSQKPIEINKGGYFDVFKTLLKPALHIPVIFPTDTTLKSWYLGAFLMGADVTYENLYASFLAYDPIKKDLILSFYLQSLFFSPLGVNLQYAHKNSAGLELNYPLLIKLSPGLSSIFLFLDGRTFNDFSRREINPGMTLQFRYPYSFMILEFNLPMERKLWGSSIDRTAVILKISARKYVKGGELKLKGECINDPDKPDSVGLKIRGYGPLHTKAGGIFTIEYAHPLLKIRKGLWNPNVFFEDLCGTVFTDIAFSREAKYNLSFGMELKLETGLMLGFIRFAPKIGVAVTKEGKTKFYGGVEL